MPKRRAGHAPPGSGVPIGTEYHWYIIAHQNVRKLDENTYTTALSGLKYKLAHKRARKDTWSASEKAQRRQLIKILQETIDDLSAEPPVESPASEPTAANAEVTREHETKRRTSSAGQRPTRRGSTTRRRLVAAAGQRRH